MSSFDRHIHDCDDCKFLGCFISEHKTLDVYKCGDASSKRGPSLIMRYSSKGEDYYSFSVAHAREINLLHPDSRWNVALAMYDAQQ